LWERERLWTKWRLKYNQTYDIFCAESNESLVVVVWWGDKKRRNLGFFMLERNWSFNYVLVKHASNTDVLNECNVPGFGATNLVAIGKISPSQGWERMSLSFDVAGAFWLVAALTYDYLLIGWVLLSVTKMQDANLAFDKARSYVTIGNLYWRWNKNSRRACVANFCFMNRLQKSLMLITGTVEVQSSPLLALVIVTSWRCWYWAELMNAEKRLLQGILCLLLISLEHLTYIPTTTALKARLL